MARIIGTPRYDFLEGTDSADVIHGRGDGDLIYGLGGDDRLFGDGGNDFIDDQDGWNQIWGGRGDDTIQFARGIARGGLGDDTVAVSGGGWAGGGEGDDRVSGAGYLCGDALPGGDTSIVGNDTLSMNADADSARANGGLGNDRFYVYFGNDDYGLAIIEDFTPGEDKLRAVIYPEGEEEIDLWSHWDVNGDGALTRDDTLLGAQVWFAEAVNTTVLGTGNGHLIVEGTTHLTTADWLLG